jgi:hypothetical protein
MTDVPYTALTIFSAIFYARSLRNGSDRDLIIGTILAIAATLSRQLAVSVPLAYAVSLILTRGFTNRNILRGALTLAFCLGALLVFQHWLTASGRVPVLYYAKTKDLLHVFRKTRNLGWPLVKKTCIGLLYLGWFLLPILIFSVADILRCHRKKTIALLKSTIGIMILVFGACTLCGRCPFMPMSKNILIKSGIGPLTLRDTYILHLNHVPTLPMGFWLVITAMSFLGAAFLIATLGIHITNLKLRMRLGGKMSDNEAVGIFLLLSAMMYLLPLFVSHFYDRYLFPTIPFIAAGIAGVSGCFSRFPRIDLRTLRLAAVTLLFAFSLFAIGITKDYLAWNRVRWEALHDLIVNNHVHMEDIDGGFEFNGLYLYNPHYQKVPGKSWWWVQRDTYQIDFNNIPGYRVIKEYSYPCWMPPHIGKVVVLQLKV